MNCRSQKHTTLSWPVWPLKDKQTKLQSCTACPPRVGLLTCICCYVKHGHVSKFVHIAPKIIGLSEPFHAKQHSNGGGNEEKRPVVAFKL
jgi:hypothetical protein